MSSTRHTAIQELLLDRVVECWRGYRRVGWYGRLFDWLASFHPPDLIWVAEQTWTNESRSFAGPLVGNWTVDDRGVTPGDGAEPSEGGRRGMYFVVFRVRFAISPDGRRVMWSELRGPRAGSGFALAVEGEGPSLRITELESLWKS